LIRDDSVTFLRVSVNSDLKKFYIEYICTDLLSQQLSPADTNKLCSFEEELTSKRKLFENKSNFLGLRVIQII
jgi:hypothetical protein